MSTRKTFYIIEKNTLRKLKLAAQSLRPDKKENMPTWPEVREIGEQLNQIIKEIARDTANEFARKLRKEM